MTSSSGDDNSGNRLFGVNPSPPNFMSPFKSRPSDMSTYGSNIQKTESDRRSNRIGAAPFSSHFTFTGGPFLPPSSTQTTNTNSPFTDSATTFGSISPQQYGIVSYRANDRYKSPPPPTGNMEPTRLPMIPTPPPPQSSAASARQTYATSTPGIHRHTSNDSISSQQQNTSHHHHAPAVHAPLSEGGPPFQSTELLHRLYLPGTMAGAVQLNLHPKVDRGFFVAPEDNEWTCYRRNYFQLSLAYTITSQNPNLSNESLLAAGIMLDYHGRQERVTAFKITIGARVYGSDAKIIDLVQHTPKRDKGP